MVPPGSVEPDLPQGPEDGLVELQPHAHVECRLTDGCPQLPDRRQTNAIEPSQIRSQRRLRVSSKMTTPDNLVSKH